ncbi:LysR family transcriptional regulator [Pantoea ananatis]|uniref:LysR family transcriptional regulator n=1 Tax=Pantoea ananas TaxID=553 RepID=UPI002350A89A|nr:LysR family transcriptional regulator [Pantoea ananatis]MDC7861823.1 hypothetical protein [Pantoea ananatis]
MDKDNNRGMWDWLIFIRTAEAGSISEAARQLNISTAAVSKAVSRFEKYLGAVLFNRTSQGMNLTEAGRTTWSFLVMDGSSSGAGALLLGGYADTAGC